MSRLPCFNLSRNALLGMRSPFSSSPRNKVVFMGFMKDSGPFSANHVLGHCTGKSSILCEVYVERWWMQLICSCHTSVGNLYCNTMAWHGLILHQ